MKPAETSFCFLMWAGFALAEVLAVSNLVFGNLGSGKGKGIGRMFGELR